MGTATSFVDYNGLVNFGKQFLSNSEELFIKSASVNGIKISKDENGNVNISVPKKLSELSNDRAYVTSVEVDAQIQAKLADFNNYTTSVVDKLPEYGEEDTLYFVTKDDVDEKDQYLYLNGEFVKIGTTAIDLSDYIKTDEVKAITSAEVASALSDIFQ